MKICVDIDGVLCTLRKEDETYADVQALPGAAEHLKSLKEAGHYIILNTARHMATCKSNVGMVIARQGKTLIHWLEEHEMVYDELWFGKPHADVYIDDNAYRFEGWDKIAGDGSSLPLSEEKRAKELAKKQS
ncbi:MAG: capsular biosynthesis protein [Akkermansiaceae bacterium]